MIDAPEAGGRPPLAARTKNVTTRFDAEHVAALDQLAHRTGSTRSALIRQAVHTLLTTPPEEEPNE